jgi:hypothetical protein
MTLHDFLLWLANSGGGAVVVSWVLEQLSWYQNMVAKTKQLVFFGITLLVTVAGFAVVAYVPQVTLDAIAPYFGLVYATFVSIFLGTAFHNTTKIDKPEVQTLVIPPVQNVGLGYVVGDSVTPPVQ